jgi:ankyrin repeat protein
MLSILVFCSIILGCASTQKDLVHLPLHEAIIDKEADKVKSLLDKGADVEAKDKDEQTPLIYSSRLRNIEITKILLNHGVDVNARDHDGQTALMHASWNGNVNIVELLLKYGSDVNIKANGLGLTSLHLASGKGYSQIVDLLLINGADVNARLTNGETAIISASSKGYTDVVRKLLNYGADLEIEKHSKTALAYSVSNNNLDTVQLLLAHNINVDHKDESGQTPLIRAAYRGYTEIVSILLIQGADRLQQIKVILI